MAFKMRGFSPFTKPKREYPKGKPRYLKNLMYKITGNNKYLKK